VTETERDPERCQRCGNWPELCGHDLPFAERIKTVRANTENLKAARR
jgi:L-lactate utilization protein LutB